MNIKKLIDEIIALIFIGFLIVIGIYLCNQSGLIGKAFGSGLIVIGMIYIVLVIFTNRKTKRFKKKRNLDEIRGNK